MPRVVSSLAELAKALDVDFSTAFRWKSAGVPVEPDGGFDVDKVDAWRKERVSNARRRGPPAMEFKERESVPASSGGDDKRWTNEYRKAKALKEVMLLQELRGQLIETEKVESFLVARALELRKSLLGLGRRLAPVLVGRTTREIQAEVDAATSRILEEYSREEGMPKATKGGAHGRAV